MGWKQLSIEELRWAHNRGAYRRPPRPLTQNERARGCYPEVPGSKPGAVIADILRVGARAKGALSSGVERLIRIQEVVGSIPTESILRE